MSIEYKDLPEKLSEWINQLVSQNELSEVRYLGDGSYTIFYHGSSVPVYLDDDKWQEIRARANTVSRDSDVGKCDNEGNDKLE